MDFGPVCLSKRLTRDQKRGVVRRTTDAPDLRVVPVRCSWSSHIPLLDYAANRAVASNLPSPFTHLSDGRRSARFFFLLYFSIRKAVLIVPSLFLHTIAA